MSNDSPDALRPLPQRPNLRHLKDQARDLLRAGVAASLTEAQFQISRLYGFASWPKLKAHIDSLREVGQLKQAIDRNDFDRVKELMIRNPALHQAPIGYGKNGPLTWVAECRVPWEAPTPMRLAMAQWMIENGSDIHQGGDGPLMRATLNRDRIPMMELLVAHGADVNAQWNGDYPILFAACETVNPPTMQWLLDHGADPNCPKHAARTTALDYLIGTYVRSHELTLCVDLLVCAGGTTKYDLPGVLDVVSGRIDRLAARLDADPQLVHRQFPELDCGSTGARRLLLQGGTLLHVAAEFGHADAAGLLIERGADVNARGASGQTAIFHSVSQFRDWGLAVTRVLLDHGADVAVRAAVPGHYERPDEIVECTALGYGIRFPGDEGYGSNEKTLKLLRERGPTE